LSGQDKILSYGRTFLPSCSIAGLHLIEDEGDYLFDLGLTVISINLGVNVFHLSFVQRCSLDPNSLSSAGNCDGSDCVPRRWEKFRFSAHDTAGKQFIVVTACCHHAFEAPALDRQHQRQATTSRLERTIPLASPAFSLVKLRAPSASSI